MSWFYGFLIQRFTFSFRLSLDLRFRWWLLNRRLLFLLVILLLSLELLLFFLLHYSFQRLLSHQFFYLVSYAISFLQFCLDFVFCLIFLAWSVVPCFLGCGFVRSLEFVLELRCSSFAYVSDDGRFGSVVKSCFQCCLLIWFCFLLLHVDQIVSRF